MRLDVHIDDELAGLLRRLAERHDASLAETVRRAIRVTVRLEVERAALAARAGTQRACVVCSAPRLADPLKDAMAHAQCDSIVSASRGNSPMSTDTATTTAPACRFTAGGRAWTCKLHGLACATLDTLTLTEGEKAAIAAERERLGIVTFTADKPAEPERSPEPTTTPAPAADLGTPEPVRAGRPVFHGGDDDPYRAYGVRGVPSLLPDRKGVVELFEATSTRRAAMVSTPAAAAFATVTTTQTGRDVSLLPDRVTVPPRRIAEIAGLPATEIGMGSGAAFPIFGAGTADVAAEGALKAEYDAIAPGTATPQVIAVWTDITVQTQGLLAFEARLRNKLARLVASRENELLRAKVAGTAGIQTLSFGGTSQSARILQGAAMVEAAINVPPDVFLFNPEDTEAIFGPAIGNAAPAEVARMVLSLHGMIGVPLSTQPAGFVLAGAWAAASRLVVGIRPTYKVDPYSQMKNNIVTVLLEEAVDLAVEEPEGFISIDITE